MQSVDGCHVVRKIGHDPLFSPGVNACCARDVSVAIVFSSFFFSPAARTKTQEGVVRKEEDVLNGLSSLFVCGRPELG